MEQQKINSKKFGDMPVEDFRKHGHEMIEWIADYLENIEQYPVFPNIYPGEIKNKIPLHPPVKGESIENIFSDFEKIIVPGTTHWNHPGFMAYFNSSASTPGILAELLSAALNANGMIWKTSPSATELELASLNWLRQMLGLNDKFMGIIYDTASISSMHAIAAAREQLKEYQFKEKGMTGRKDVPRLRLYASEHAHSSIDKGALTLGIGIEGIRKIPVNKEFKMIPTDLTKAINEDRKNGWCPFCVVATVGTTSTTSIDPVDKIADICERENIWLHVDGAHGGSAAIIPEMQWILKGTERADSFLVNPHKWLFHPVDITAFYTRKPDVLKRAFSLVADYLKTSEAKVDNYMDYGIQLGRRFRALKLWFVIRYFGVEGLRERLRYHLYLGKEFTKWIDEHPNFERMAPVPMSTICFRLHPKNINAEKELEELNLRFFNELDTSGDIMISHTRLNDKYVLRVNMSGLRMELKHIEKAWEIIRTKGEATLMKV